MQKESQNWATKITGRTEARFQVKRLAAWQRQHTTEEKYAGLARQKDCVSEEISQEKCGNWDRSFIGRKSFFGSASSSKAFFERDNCRHCMHAYTYSTSCFREFCIGSSHSYQNGILKGAGSIQKTCVCITTPFLCLWAGFGAYSMLYFFKMHMVHMIICAFATQAAGVSLTWIFPKKKKKGIGFQFELLNILFRHQPNQPTNPNTTQHQMIKIMNHSRMNNSYYFKRGVPAPPPRESCMYVLCTIHSGRSPFYAIR